MLTQADKQYLLATFATKDELHQTKDEIVTILSNIAGDIQSMREELQVVSQHSIENFDTNEVQDKRLDRVEQHLGLPRLAIE